MKAKRRPPLRPLESPATDGQRFFVDYDGPRGADGLIINSQMFPVICDRTTGTRDPRPGMTESARDAEVARLNAGLPVSNKSQESGRRPRYASEAARWVEVLRNVPEKRAVLQAALDTGRKLSADDVRALMTFPPELTWLRLPDDKVAARNLVNAVLTQLGVFGIQKGMAGDTGAQLNSAKESKRRESARARALRGIVPADLQWMKPKK
jgi:hypothetical protein